MQTDLTVLWLMKHLPFALFSYSDFFSSWNIYPDWLSSLIDEQNHHLHEDDANFSSCTLVRTWATTKLHSFRAIMKIPYSSERFYSELAKLKILPYSTKHSKWFCQNGVKLRFPSTAEARMAAYTLAMISLCSNILNLSRHCRSSRLALWAIADCYLHMHN